MNTLLNLHKYLVEQRGLGTFLKFEIAMGGSARATYTHGNIEFANMQEVAAWADVAATNPMKNTEAAWAANREHLADLRRPIRNRKSQISK